MLAATTNRMRGGDPLIAGIAEALAVKTHPLRYNLAVVIDQLAVAVTKIQSLEARLAEVEREVSSTAGFTARDSPTKEATFARTAAVLLCASRMP